jgi:hypothetical protein
MWMEKRNVCNTFVVAVAWDLGIGERDGGIFLYSNVDGATAPLNMAELILFKTLLPHVLCYCDHCDALYLNPA